jgi:hypothetical protein
MEMSLLLTHKSHFIYRRVPTFGFGRLATMHVDSKLVILSSAQVIEGNNTPLMINNYYCTD